MHSHTGLGTHSTGLAPALALLFILVQDLTDAKQSGIKKKMLEVKRATLFMSILLVVKMNAP
jgi:hypothetical protein